MLFFSLINPNTMNKKYFVIPEKPIWNNEAIVNEMYSTYFLESVAIDRAELLSRKYNATFIVCSSQTKVEVQVQIKKYKS